MQEYLNIMSGVKLEELELRFPLEDLEPITVDWDERCEHELVRELNNASCDFNVGQRYIVFDSVVGAEVLGLSSETSNVLKK